MKVDRTFGDVGQLDLVILPGGPAVVPTDPKKREPVPAWEEEVISFIRAQAPGARVVASVCVSSGIDLGLYLLARFFGNDAMLAEAGYLDGPWPLWGDAPGTTG